MENKNKKENGNANKNKNKNARNAFAASRNVRMPATTAAATIAAVVVAALLLLATAAGLPAKAHAAQIDASLIPEYDRAAGIFTGTKFLQIRYEKGSALSELFNGKTERIEFSVGGSANNSSNNKTGMDGLVAAINQALLKAESPVRVAGANLTYTGVLKGGPDSLIISYRVELKPSFSGFKLGQSQDGKTITMDINWRGFAVEGPVVLAVDTQGRGSERAEEININQPSGLLEVVFPEFAEKLVGDDGQSNAGAREILSEPILDFREIGGMSMERWHSLFDPTFAIASTKGMIRGEDIGSAKVLSVYSLGECSIREGCPPPKEAEAMATVDGTSVQLRISTPQPNAQIEIAGFTSIEEAGGHEVIRVSMESPGMVIPGFTVQVLMVLGGMMGAVAVFVLVKAKK